MNIDTAHLRALAEKATPGPWTDEPYLYADEDGRVRVTSPHDGADFNLAESIAPDNAAFIAAANPQVVLALLDEVERLRAWKAEAMAVLAEWERTWEAAGRPGAWGQSKAVTVRELIERLRETPEPSEWEYAALGEHGEPLFRGGPFKNIGVRLTELAEEGWPIYRRPAPGPWEPAENAEEGQDA